jgi:cytoskeletal protein RodZ
MPDEQFQPSTPAPAPAPAPMPPRSKAGKVLGTILVLVLLAVGAAAFFGFQAYQTISDEKTQQDADLTSLRRQLAEAQATPAPTVAPSPTPAPTPIPAVTLKEFGVSFTPTSDIADVTASYVASGKAFGFTSKSLAAKGADCAAPGALGGLSRVAKGAAAPAATAKVATVGAYDYYLSASSAGCAAVAGAATIQTAQNTSLKTALAGLK